MKIFTALTVCLLFISCARMGENVKSSGDGAPMSSSSGTKSDAEAMARSKAAAYCQERGFAKVIEIEMHTSESPDNSPRCQTVKVPCPTAKNAVQDTRPGKMCLEHQCAEKSRGWVSHLLFECH